MAESYSISYTDTSITFTFSTTRAYYFRCFVRTPDNTTIIDEWVGYHNSGYTVTFNVLSPDTAYVCNAQYSLLNGSDGTWMGAMEFTTYSSSRPSKFSWDTAKVSGNTFNLTASEWNRLTANVNAVRVYKGYPQYSFTTAVKDNDFTASIYNEVASAIKEMGYGSDLNNKVEKEWIVYDWRLNDLVTAINSIT